MRFDRENLINNLYHENSLSLLLSTTSTYYVLLTFYVTIGMRDGRKDDAQEPTAKLALPSLASYAQLTSHREARVVREGLHVASERLGDSLHNSRKLRLIIDGSKPWVVEALVYAPALGWGAAQHLGEEMSGMLGGDPIRTERIPSRHLSL